MSRLTSGSGHRPPPHQPQFAPTRRHRLAARPGPPPPPPPAAVRPHRGAPPRRAATRAAPSERPPPEPSARPASGGITDAAVTPATRQPGRGGFQATVAAPAPTVVPIRRRD